MKKVSFKKRTCTIYIVHYENGRLGFLLRDAKNGSHIATPTVNMPSIDLDQDEVCIKNYSENEGMLGALIAARVVLPPRRYIRSGFVKIPICKINFNPNEEILGDKS